ncbi:MULTISPECIES: protein-export chaperone SecB [Methylobacillus]|uniref:Protein-export protein SecB n=1 Tax=Methylobacillus flagellatus (strain ATCC 51484 / DSM 6875 / VKM B-1610 / KT) TaxID=265072 RepID=SECB_METFK|nr:MULTISPECIES: protein-export chaperone SecB [Methylobacillus]Q1GZ85.1 RecName: Full=Protein-export protein SecB [Methylobacillus flagellatus KT]ABE50452.1 protein translocase subunit secB [Methylobacillus flagellatus KT]MPS49925.1 protein-export chaperone SecB [Methylobacillus sp.]
MAEEQAAAQEQQPAFGIEKVYVKDLSLEIPHAPQIFIQREAPQVSIELSNATAQLEEGIYEVVVTVTVTSKIADKTVFLVEVAQAGIFQIRNVPQENIDIILGVTCPNIIFPYARETISDVVTRAGFPPVLLNPVNFEALYAQQKQEQAKANGATTH